jgi:hypothetical protein
MVDFYGLPSEGGGAWPGRDLATGINATAKAQFVEQALASAVMSEMGHSFDPHRFIPFIVMHEFEGLLFSDCSAFARAIGKGSLEPSLQTIRDQFETPEDINDSPSTMQASLIILGSGTSMGVPTLGCDCRVCVSPDPRDNRLRPSAAIVWNGHCVIIDTGPDFRTQALNHRIGKVDAVLYTHSHADHILGMDDLRPLSFKSTGKNSLSTPTTPTAQVLETIFDYTFSEDSQYKLRARVQLNRLNGSDSVESSGASFQRIPLLHGPMETGGYRIRQRRLPDRSERRPRLQPRAARKALRSSSSTLCASAPIPATPTSRKPSSG